MLCLNTFWLSCGAPKTNEVHVSGFVLASTLTHNRFIQTDFRNEKQIVVGFAAKLVCLFLLYMGNAGKRIGHGGGDCLQGTWIYLYKSIYIYMYVCIRWPLVGHQAVEYGSSYNVIL